MSLQTRINQLARRAGETPRPALPADPRAHLRNISALIDAARRHAAHLVELEEPPGIRSHVHDLARALDCADAMTDNMHAAIAEPTRTPKPCTPCPRETTGLPEPPPLE